MTRHATLRARQRALPPEILSIIYEFGAAHHSRGALSLVLDKGSIELAADGDNRRWRELAPFRGTYLVLGEHGRVITAARRTRRRRDH